MAEITKGRRLPDRSEVGELREGGDYFRATVINGKGESEDCVWFLLPGGRSLFHINDDDERTPLDGVHRVMSPPWTFRECDDGSLEIRASIACGRSGPDGEYWHGFLDEGHAWREV